MTNYREILRMNSLGFNKTEISQSLQCSRTTVRTVIRLAEEHNLPYPLPGELSDKDLYEALFPAASGKVKYKMPDYEHVYKELQRDGVTLDLLWREYVDECRLAGELPYQSTQFNKYYNDFCARKNATITFANIKISCSWERQAAAKPILPVLWALLLQETFSASNM